MPHDASRVHQTKSHPKDSIGVHIESRNNMGHRGRAQIGQNAREIILTCGQGPTCPANVKHGKAFGKFEKQLENSNISVQTIPMVATAQNFKLELEKKIFEIEKQFHEDCRCNIAIITKIKT